MKRKDIGQLDAPQSRRRQPQISCAFCRNKKLKCDRTAPCSNCVARGLDCQGSPAAKSTLPIALARSSEIVGTAGILERLQVLEQAVRQGSQGTGHAQRLDNTSSPSQLPSGSSRSKSNVVYTPALSLPESEHQQTARFLDSTYTQEDFSLSGIYHKHRFYVESADSSNEPQPATQIEDLKNGRLIGLMPRDDALALLRDFLDKPYHLLPFIHEVSTRLLIDDFYTCLDNGQQVSSACAGLILGISATSAYFWNEGGVTHHKFPSTEEAFRKSVAWRMSAFAVLDGSHSETGLEDVQARTILSYLVYNSEGLSARARFLHGCTLVAARDIGLHLVDSPKSQHLDDPPTREIKRRLWWHLASTDWMMGFMGSPLDGTYTVHPRFMNVKHPRNLNDNDLTLYDDTFTFPLNVPTQMSCFLQRIRLGEIIRAVVDARPPGHPDVEMVDHPEILRLDRLFEQAMSDLPPFLKLDAPIPLGAPQHLDLQRSIIHLGFYSRRARLHRPFLLQGAQQRQHQQSIDICLNSARTVLGIAAGLLQRSLGIIDDDNKSTSPSSALTLSPSYHRLGTVISHMFVACTILALNVGLQSSAADTLGGLVVDPESRSPPELSKACQLLSAAGRESPVAAGLVRGLVGVLRRYHVKGVEDIAVDLPRPQDGYSEQERDSIENVPPTAMIDQHQTTLGNTVGTDDLGLDELWSDIMNTMPMTDGWDQVFAQLDTFCAAT